ncbi:MAG: heme-binding domain-containing protein [Bacteroidetes bacterium]|nr:heme-binding domain-containing protein [Bacteroidota bacterium]
MKRALRLVLSALFAVFVIIQFFQTDHANPPVRAEISAPPAVKAVFRRACYDCHSNETVWRWYSYVNPMGWLVGGHVADGRRRLNFSEWETLDAQKKYHMKQEIIEQVEEGEMPLQSYLLLHSDAKLSAEDRGAITRWAQDSSEK